MRSAASSVMPGRLVSWLFEAELRSSGLSELGRVSPSRTPCATALASSLSSAVASAVFCRTWSGLGEFVLQAVKPKRRIAANRLVWVRMACGMHISRHGLIAGQFVFAVHQDESQGVF